MLERFARSVLRLVIVGQDFRAPATERQRAPARLCEGGMPCTSTHLSENSKVKAFASRTRKSPRSPKCPSRSKPSAPTRTSYEKATDLPARCRLQGYSDGQA